MASSEGEDYYTHSVADARREIMVDANRLHDGFRHLAARGRITGMSSTKILGWRPRVRTRRRVGECEPGR